MSAPLCISYIRFSTKAQLEGSSLERQLDMSRKYAADHGLHLDETLSYQDLGKSAYSAEHVKSGRLGDLLKLIRQGRIPSGSVLLVEALDRLSRENIMDALAQFTEIINEDITIVTLRDNKKYSKASLISNMGDLIVSITIMMQAHEESLLKSDRIRRAFNSIRNNLHITKQTRNCPQWLTLSDDRTTFHVIDGRADLVRRIYSMSYDGLGIKTIVRTLNEEGIPALRSTTGWCQSTVRKILSSRAVIGEFQPHTSVPGTKRYEPVGDPRIGYFPRIIDDEMFNAVQCRLANGTHRAGRTAKVENLFGGITKCGYCGARMDVVTKGKFPDEIRNLVCDNARRGIGSCTHLGLKCNELEKAFLEYCREKDIVDLLHEECNQEKSKSLDLMRQVASYEGELIGVDKQIQLYDEELEESEDKVERSHIRDRMKNLLHRKQDIDVKIVVLKKEIDSIDASVGEAENKLNNILTIYNNSNSALSEPERLLFRTRLRNELRQIVIKVLVYPRGIYYSDLDIERVRKQYEVESSGLEEKELEAHFAIRDDDILNMKLTQSKTKDERFFTVIFKNGNYRNIKYSHQTKSYYVSADRMGDRLEWAMGGKQMRTIVQDNTADQINAEIEHYMRQHPEEVMTEEDIESMRTHLSSINDYA